MKKTRPLTASLFALIACCALLMLGCALTVDKRQTINNHFPAEVTVSAEAGIGTALVHNDQSGSMWTSDTQAEQALEGTANVGLNAGDGGTGLGGAAAGAAGEVIDDLTGGG
jgi:hypothetical protein